MEVKIGIQHVSRELSVETDESTAQITEAFQRALAEDGVLTLSDTKGGSTLVRADRIAYLDFGKEQARRVGFGAL